MKEAEADSDDGLAREAGCCRRCQLRFMGCRLPQYYAQREDELKPDEDLESQPSIKRFKPNVCVCCLGVLQPYFWDSILDAVKDRLRNIEYDSDKFACGLSLPTSVMLREHSMKVFLKENGRNIDDVVAFKQAWKWSFGSYMAQFIGKELDSGSLSQFLITLHMEYKHDTDELECLKQMIPKVFEEREKSHRKFRGEMFTRASVESYLGKIDATLFKKYYNCPPKPPDEIISCIEVEYNHESLYLGGRYIKYSRELPQTPWVVDGKRIMENSIQEIIFNPLIDFFGIPTTSLDSKMKFISSGREDVDVRCLGEGRPFAVEILNPKITKLTSIELEKLQNLMSCHFDLLKITQLQIIKKDSLTTLKMGEESKTKTYEALCIKLPNEENNETDAITEEEILRINSFGNIPGEKGVLIKQKTPIRVLHRRPLLCRPRKVLEMEARLVNDKPNLFIVNMTTEAGTYIKEFVHGDLGRTKPNLSQILGFKVDILALDVEAINLEWP